MTATKRIKRMRKVAPAVAVVAPAPHLHVSKDFVLGGNAIFTIELPVGSDLAKKYGPHRTYKVWLRPPTEKFPDPVYWVSYLSGPDNTASYTYMGKLDAFTGQVTPTPRSKVTEGAFVLKLLNRTLARVWSDDHAAYEQAGFRTHHEGKCGRCGRALTVPESVTSGIGPECARIMGVDRNQGREEIFETE